MRCFILSSAFIGILVTLPLGLATTIRVPAQEPTIQAGENAPHAAARGEKILDAGPKNVLSLQPKGTGRKIDFTMGYPLNRQSTCEIGNESPPTRT